MGSKITKFLLLVLFFCFSLITCNAETYVRVGISDNNFKNLPHSNLSVFASSDWALYDKSTSALIMKFQSEDLVEIKLEDGKFFVYKNGKIAIKNYTGVLIVHSPNGTLNISGLKRKAKQVMYHGIFELIPRNEKTFYVVNVLELQQYLKGVVPNEMPVSFGLEALKAQAVAARNYVLMPRTRAYKEFDVDDSVASQVYFGANTETELSNKAVDETSGLVALYNGQLILAQYCSTAGGYTEDFQNAFSDNTLKIFPAKQKPYLKGRPDMLSFGSLQEESAARNFYMTKPSSYDIFSPYYRWTKEFDKNELEQTLQKTLISQSKTGFVYPMFTQNNQIGTLKEIKVLRRGVSGKIMELEIHTTEGIWRVQKELVVRRIFQKNGVSLPSANAVFEHIYDENGDLSKIVIYGGGFGHGVGMSQYGAGFMAKNLGKSFSEILQRYYYGINIATVPITVSSNNSPYSVEFYAPKKHAYLVVDNRCNISELSANINGEVVKIPLYKKNIGSELRIDISRYIGKGKNNIAFSVLQNGCWVKLYVEVVEKNVL